MRIALLCQEAAPVDYGTAGQAVELGKGLQARGVKVEILAGNSSLAARRDVVDGVRIVRMPGESLIRQLPAQTSALARAVTFIGWAMLRLLRRRYDVIHVEGGAWLALAAVLPARMNRTPLLVKVNHFGAEDARTLRRPRVGRLRVGRVASAPLRTASAIVAATEELAVALTECFPETAVARFPDGSDFAHVVRFYEGLYESALETDGFNRRASPPADLTARRATHGLDQPELLARSDTDVGHASSPKVDAPGWARKDLWDGGAADAAVSHEGDEQDLQASRDKDAEEDMVRGLDGGEGNAASASDGGDARQSEHVKPAFAPEGKHSVAATQQLARARTPQVRATSGALVAKRSGRPAGFGARVRVSGDTLAIIAAVLAAAVVGAIAGVADLGGGVSHPETAAEYALIACGVVAAVSLRSGNPFALRNTGPGVHVVGLALAFTFFLGVFVVAPDLRPREVETIVLLSVSVAAFVVGAMLTAPIFLVRGKLLRPTDAPPVTDNRIVLWISGLFALAALINLVTGSVPLLSGNINGTRFGGGTGAALHIGAWIDGGLEWSAVVAGAAIVRAKRLDKWSAALGLLGLVPLILLAGRSFLLIIAVSLLVVIAAMHRVSLIRLTVTIVVGIALLGAAGQYRSLHSFETGRAASRSFISTIFNSAGIGPTVFSSVLERIPAEIPYQHGGFFTRDFRAVLPLHPLGRPEPSDYWVTSAVRDRDTSRTGGSPPTLAGGLYIDFGIPGVIFGAALIGALLVMIYRWVLKVGTIGALALYAYAAAYAALAAYSYVSFKPTMLTVLILAYLLHRIELRSEGRSLVPAT